MRIEGAGFWSGCCPLLTAILQLIKSMQVSQFQILKFRSFVSKQQEGFVIIVNNNSLPELIFEDILFQLFLPIFEDLPCPDIYYFSSTDQILSYSEMMKMQGYIYVHFIQRIKHYSKKGICSSKFKIGDLDKLSKGVDFSGNNLYIFSEQCYMIYEQQYFRQMIYKRISNIKNMVERKQIKYEEFMAELSTLKDNSEFVKLRKEIELTVDQYNNKLARLQKIFNRYRNAKRTLANVLKSCEIRIREIKDLY